MLQLLYHRGTILAKGGYSVPHAVWDERIEAYRIQAMYYQEVCEYLERSKISFEDRVLDLIPCPQLTAAIELRDYQKEAMANWVKVKRGVIVLPTGSGKTILALKLIETMNTSTFIVVPTLALVQQWIEALQIFRVPLGEYSGIKKDLQSITVSTYDSAYIGAEYLGNKFKFLIFDEVHHLPAEGYRQIAEMFASPYRLGLTATYKRADGLHADFPKLVGGLLYTLESTDLAGTYLAPYEIVRIPIQLTETEALAYTQHSSVFKAYLASRNIKLRHPQDFRKIVIRSGSDPAARAALLAHQELERIAFNSQNKLEKIQELLDPYNRTLIFTRYNDLAYAIARRFFIPCITHQTSSEERRDILRKFKRGTYSALVSSQVLDEGIDVPDANVGILVSGTGSSRQFVQRLGRLLRPQPGKTATLYELVTQRTKEVRTASRRHE